MVRPATPLTILFLIAFILLLLSTLSVPIIKSIQIAAAGEKTYGVFGYCFTNGTCPHPGIGYIAGAGLWSSDSQFEVNAHDRIDLSYILIVHPIAAFMVLICTIMAGAAHFRGPAHSPRFLLGLLIFSFPTLLVTLLAFLVDILLFIPHLQWGGWIVLPATILVTACGVLTCAMRRTLVSRKARKRRVAENADMNGSDYYQMKAETPMQPIQSQFARAESPPPMDDSMVGSNPATYDATTPPSTYDYERAGGNMDDRIPLNPRNVRSRNTDPRSGYGDGGHLSGSTMVGAPHDGANDDILQPVSPLDGPPRRSSDSNSRNRGRGGMASPYGRSEMPPYYGRGRGGYPPRGAPRGGYYLARGNFPPRGGYAPRGGPRGPPPPGWASQGRAVPIMRGGRPPPPGYGYGRPPPRDFDDSNQYGPPQDTPMDYPPMDPYSTENHGYDQPSAPEETAFAYEQPSSPNPDVRPTSATRDPASFGFSGRHPSPARSQSMSRPVTPPPPIPNVPSHIPVAAVELDTRNSRTGGSTLDYDRSLPIEALGDSAPLGDHSAGTYLPMDSWRNEPVEIGDRSPPNSRSNAEVLSQQPLTKSSSSTHEHSTRPRGASGSYYEDVAPRFSHDDPEPPVPAQAMQPVQTIVTPPSLMPGSGSYDAPYSTDNPHLAPHRDDSRSPAQSDNSNFTSISQRGINPDWQGGPSGYNPRPAPRARVNEAILSSNPDFSLPGAGPSRLGHTRGMSSGGGGGRYPEPAGGM